MSGNSAKRLIKWHTGWLGEKDANGDLVGASFCDVERKYSNGGRSSLIKHSESEKHQNIANGKKGRVTGQPGVEVEF